MVERRCVSERYAPNLEPEVASRDIPLFRGRRLVYDDGSSFLSPGRKSQTRGNALCTDRQ